MSIYYYLYNKGTNECLYLGKGEFQQILDFPGPTVLINGAKYLLPKKYLKLIIDRMKGSVGSDDVVVVPDYKLFDGVEFVSSNENIIEISS